MVKRPGHKGTRCYVSTGEIHPNGKATKALCGALCFSDFQNASKSLRSPKEPILEPALCEPVRSSDSQCKAGLTQNIYRN